MEGRGEMEGRKEKKKTMRRQYNKYCVARDYQDFSHSHGIFSLTLANPRARSVVTHAHSWLSLTTSGLGHTPFSLLTNALIEKRIPMPTFQVWQ